MKTLADKRKIEIIILLLNWFNNNNNHIRFKRLFGICKILSPPSNEQEIFPNLSQTEIDLFVSYLMSFTKRRHYNHKGYIFKPGSIKPRINLLNRMLIKLKNE